MRTIYTVHAMGHRLSLPRIFLDWLNWKKQKLSPRVGLNWPRKCGYSLAIVFSFFFFFLLRISQPSYDLPWVFDSKRVQVFRTQQWNQNKRPENIYFYWVLQGLINYCRRSSLWCSERVHSQRSKLMKMERNNGLLCTPQLDQKDTSNTLNLSYCFIIKILELTDHP